MSTIVLLVVVVALALSACLFHACSPPGAGAGDAPPGVSIRGGGSRADMRERLAKLAQSRPPKNLAPGAMCYETAAPPERFDYVCPACGEKTIHAVGDGVPWELEYDIPACRRLIREIRGLDAALDESALCGRCAPDAEVPCLALLVRYPGEEAPHRTEPIGPEDLTLLIEFLSGSKTHDAGPGGQVPLKDRMERLEALLGVWSEGKAP